jgi:hypothetical protein
MNFMLKTIQKAPKEIHLNFVHIFLYKLA